MRCAGLCAAFAMAGLAACNGEGEPAIGTPVECASGNEAYQVQCHAVVALEGGAHILTVRHQDGGFRRFRYNGDPATIETADGAAPAIVAVSADKVSIAVEQDRYVIPFSLLGVQADGR